MPKTATRIILLDIENSPNLGYVWAKYEQNVIDFKEEWFLLSFAYKVLGESGISVHGLPDYPGYRKDMHNDKKLVQELWNVLDGADIVIAHNGDRFDLRKSNARFLEHGLPPPSPYKTVDTLKLARKLFKFNSNSLDDLGRSLKVGRKLKHIGFALWLQCMGGDPKAWRTMLRYNKHDVALLERVYLLMRAWAPNHPNVNKDGAEACPTCGSHNVQKRGFHYTLRRKKQQYQCGKCFHWFQGGANKLDAK